jgi:4-amino-4-deoxy-L-arabinose transferase-like glycosyltransferase
MRFAKIRPYLTPLILMRVLLLLVLAMQLPFLHADADIEVSWSRGPYLDEGLYTSQIRNAINHGQFDHSETDGVLKAPFFNVMLYPVYVISGTGMIVSRMFVLLFTLLAFFLSMRLRFLQWAMFFSGILLLTQFLLFHHSHLGLAEMPVACFIMLAIPAYVRSRHAGNSKTALHWLFLSCLLCALSYYTKIMALYAAALVPATLLITAIILFLLKEKDAAKKTLLHFAWSIAFTALFLLVFYLCWYLPMRDFAHLVLDTQSEVTLSSSTFLQQFTNNFSGIFNDRVYKHYIIFFFCSCIMLLILTVKHGKKFLLGGYGSAIGLCLLWMLIETAKLGNHYLPSRYLVSAVFPLTIICCLLLQYLVFEYTHGLKIALLLVFLFVSRNLIFYADAIGRRTYHVQAINDYMGHYDFGTTPVMGNWGTVANYKCKAISKPVAKDYFNDKNIIATFHPRVIIAELNEENDSTNAFYKERIDLHAISDSSRTFTIRHWHPVVYWIKK